MLKIQIRNANEDYRTDSGLYGVARVSTETPRSFRGGSNSWDQQMEESPSSLGGKSLWLGGTDECEHAKGRGA